MNEREKREADRLANIVTNMMAQTFLDAGLVNKAELERLKMGEFVNRLKALKRELESMNPYERKGFMMSKMRNLPPERQKSLRKFYEIGIKETLKQYLGETDPKIKKKRRSRN